MINHHLFDIIMENQNICFSRFETKQTCNWPWQLLRHLSTSCLKFGYHTQFLPKSDWSYYPWNLSGSPASAGPFQCATSPAAGVSYWLLGLFTYCWVTSQLAMEQKLGSTWAHECWKKNYSCVMFCEKENAIPCHRTFAILAFSHGQRR